MIVYLAIGGFAGNAWRFFQQDRTCAQYALREKSDPTVTAVSSALKLHLFCVNAARRLDEASDLRVEKTAVTVGGLCSLKGYESLSDFYLAALIL